MTRARAAIDALRARVIALPGWSKRLLLAANDFAILAFALWSAWSLRLNTFYVPEDLRMAVIFLAAPTVGVAALHAQGLYRHVTRYMTQGSAAYQTYVAVFISILLWALLIVMLGADGVPRSVVLVYALIAAPGIRVSRHLAAKLLRGLPFPGLGRGDTRKPVAIYGAGEMGVQLLAALRSDPDCRAVAFLDEDSALWGRRVAGLKVLRPDKVRHLIEREGLKQVLVAMPSLTRQARGAVIRSLEAYPVVVKILPALTDIASGRVQVSDLRPIDVEDLLGRDPVVPDASLLWRDVRGRSVMITGAGGSIGSELSRQILRLGPRRLVLLDVSESALYEIEMQIQDARALQAAQAARTGTVPPEMEIVAVLGSVLDGALVRRALCDHEVQTIYHAAAYKHVPIVEANPFPGLANNSLGTLTVAEAAAAQGVERMVLVSTDKAVRPTSIMGASKRLAELVLQGMAAEPGTRTVFTMVRFGNVLDSSGSVVRRFRKQIEAGGPVTVTDANMVRYFMSIPEAAQLVIQAGAMAAGGDVFVLDMGRPVKIADLARTMIRLSGLEICDAANPDGDIAIEYIGVRPGEKLFEELLIGSNTVATSHPRILRNTEPFLPLGELRKEIDRLRDAIERYDLDAVHGVLQRTVEGYKAAQPDPEPLASDAPGWAPVSRTLH